MTYLLQDGVPRDLENVHEVLERDSRLGDQHVVQQSVPVF